MRLWSRSFSTQSASASSQCAALRPVKAVASSATLAVAPPIAQTVIEHAPSALEICFAAASTAASESSSRKRALHVEALAPGHFFIAHRLKPEIGGRRDGLGERFDLAAKSTQIALGILRRAEVRGSDRDCRPPALGRGPEAQTEMHVVRHGLVELPIQGGRFASALDRKDDDRGRHVRPDGVQAELEGRRNDTIRAGTT